MELLKLNKVAVAYQGKNVLQNISFSIQKKEIICVIGESGCGKTTLLKAIQGLLDCSKGQIFYNGKLVEGASEKLVPGTEGISTVYQDFNLEEHMSVYYNVQRELKHLKKQEQEKITKKLLQVCQIQQLSDRFPRQISGGQRQKVALAKALITEPELILLDEPFSNLDAISKQSFKSLINDLKQDKSLSFLYVTHDISDALTFADKIIILEKGKVVVNSPKEDLFKHISTVYVAQILGLKNIISGNLLNQFFQLNLLPNHFYWIPYSAITYIKTETPNAIVIKSYFYGNETSISFEFPNGFELYCSSLTPLPHLHYDVSIDVSLIQLLK